MGVHSMNAWEIGWVVGAAVVVVVAALLLAMIRGAGRAGTQAEAIVAALDLAAQNTEGLWDVDVTNRTISRVIAAAASAREHLSSGEVRP